MMQKSFTSEITKSFATHEWNWRSLPSYSTQLLSRGVHARRAGLNSQWQGWWAPLSVASRHEERRGHSERWGCIFRRWKNPRWKTICRPSRGCLAQLSLPTFIPRPSLLARLLSHSSIILSAQNFFFMLYCKKVSVKQASIFIFQKVIVCTVFFFFRGGVFDVFFNKLLLFTFFFILFRIF